MGELNEKKKLLISFSGGRTSAYMTWWMQNIWKERDNHEMVVVFANTGREREETLQFVNQCDRYFGFKTVWVEAKVVHEKRKGTTFSIVNFETASRNGEPFEQVISKYGIPNAAFLHCTRELKMQPIKSYAKSLKWSDYKIALGIRSDEPKRLDWEKSKKENIIYLAQLIQVNKSDINLHWSKQPFDLKLKGYEGNCKTCWKRTFRKLVTIARENPHWFDFMKQMELEYGYYVSEGIKNRIDKIEFPIKFFRSNKSVEDVFEMAKDKSILNAKDDSRNTNYQVSIWQDGTELDSTNGCVESCEVFS